MHLKSVRIFLFCIALATLLMAFQNCGDVRVAQEVETASKTSLLTGEFCGGIPNSDRMQLQNFFFVNLTAKAVGNRLLADSDIDGVPDETESANLALGFIKSQPNSSGILDGICWLQGGQNCVPTICDQTVLSLGLLQCDATALSSTSTLTGGDTDLDGIPDFIEIIRGLDPLRPIVDEDYDIQPNGAGSNIDEIQRGLDPLSELNLEPSFQILISASKLSAKDVCGNQDRYTFNVSSFPLIDVVASQNEKFPEFSHAINENIMMAFFVAYPVDRTKQGKIFYQILKVNKDSGPPTLSMDPMQFKLLSSFDLPPL